MVFANMPGTADGISLDKLTPELGYVEGNVVFCAFRVNTMKGPLTEAEFYKSMRAILRRAELRSFHADDPPHERATRARGRR